MAHHLIDKEVTKKDYCYILLEMTGLTLAQ